MATRAAIGKEAMLHTLTNVLGLTNADPLYIAVMGATPSFTDFVGLNDNMIKGLTYIDPTSQTSTPLTAIQGRKLVLMRWYYLYEQESTRLEGGRLELTDVKTTLTEEGFEDFSLTKSVFLAQGATQDVFFAKAFAHLTAPAHVAASYGASIGYETIDVRPQDPNNLNLRADAPSGEISDETEPVLHSLGEQSGIEEAKEKPGVCFDFSGIEEAKEKPGVRFDFENSTLPTVDPMTTSRETDIIPLSPSNIIVSKRQEEDTFNESKSSRLKTESRTISGTSAQEVWAKDSSSSKGEDLKSRSSHNNHRIKEIGESDEEDDAEITFDVIKEIGESDEEDDADIMFDGIDLLSGLDDHFSLRKPSCLVRSRKKGGGVRVYDPGFGQQLVIEETYDQYEGLKVQVKTMNDVTIGHRLMNTFYAIVAALFSGFLFVFCLQLLLFTVLNLSIESGATSVNTDSHGATMIGIVFALLAFSKYFAEALVIAGQFIVDAYEDHPLSRTFILRSKQNGHIFIEWVFLFCFCLFPIVVGCIMLFTASDHWWYNTALSWFVLVAVFFAIFCFSVVYYEVGSAYNFVANRDDTDPEDIMDVLKRAVLLRQTRLMSGYVTKAAIARNVFMNSDSTDRTMECKIKKKSLDVTTPIWTRFVSRMPSFLFVNLTENPRTIRTIHDVQDYRPFLTKQSWSLERIFCRPEHSRYIAIVQGPGSVTAAQVRSSVICSFLGIVMLGVIVAGFLDWFGFGNVAILFFLAIVILLKFGSLRNTYKLMRLAKDLVDVRKNIAPGIAAGNQTRSRRETLSWQSDRKVKESEAVFYVSQLERHYEATNTMCWISFVVELGLFFVYPAVTLLLIDRNLGLLFFFFSIVSNLRWYINIVTAIEETGNMDLVGGVTAKLRFENKSRLNHIVLNISANPAYKGWRIVMTSLGLASAAILLSTFQDGVVQGSLTGFKYLPYGEFKYPGAAEDMRYPTCTLSSLKGGFADKSTMLDFAWLATTAYLKDSNTQHALDNWFIEDAGVKDEQEVVEAFLDQADPDREFAVKFKLVSVPGPEEGQTTGIILIRGTVNQFDMLADAQLWSAAALMQWLRGIIPIGEIWTEIFSTLVMYMNTVASTSIEKVAFYKLTTKFVNHLKDEYSFDYLQVTGHSLGGGLSLITGAQAKIPAIGLSAPNARISGLSYDPPITSADINKYGFNIIPEYDMVAKLDDVADNWQQIGCTADISSALVECHDKIRSVCELMYTCGSGNRPVFCECVKKFGYPEPTPAEGVTTDFREFCNITDTD